MMEVHFKHDQHDAYYSRPKPKPATMIDKHTCSKLDKVSRGKNKKIVVEFYLRGRMYYINVHSMSVTAEGSSSKVPLMKTRIP